MKRKQTRKQKKKEYQGMASSSGVDARRGAWLPGAHGQAEAAYTDTRRVRSIRLHLGGLCKQPGGDTGETLILLQTPIYY